MPQVERFPMGIPYGWYFVAYSDELKVGDVRPAHYFGRDLVIFRGESGKAGVLDAYCPHLGAHMGHGGRVEGDSVVCPFHEWKFDPEGFCTDIPYARVFPPRAKREPLAEAYPVTEANGVVWAWYHPQGVKPLFDVEIVPEFTEPGWAPHVRREWRFASNPQEIGENGVDFAHFRYVHSMNDVPQGASRYEDHIRYSEVHGKRNVPKEDGTEVEIDASVLTVQTGAGQKTTRMIGQNTLILQVLATPVEADDVELRFCFTHTPVEPGSIDEKMIMGQIEGTCGQTGVEGDLPIWHHKIHRAKPFLCDGDGPILRYRKYFEQFYVSDTPEEQQLAAE